MKIIQTDINPEPRAADYKLDNESLACVALFSVWKTSLQGRTRAFLHGNKITNAVERPQRCQIKLKKRKKKAMTAKKLG